MKFMKALEKVFLTFIITLFVGGNLMAQDEVEITDADLKAYAALQLSTEVITSSISPAVNELIAAQEGMTGNRFNELRSKSGEPAKEWEVKFMQTVQEMIEKRTEAAKGILNTMINNSSLTVAKYKKIKADLNSDDELKARYDTVVKNLM